MNTTIDGVDYRIGFRHKQSFAVKDGKRHPQSFALPKVKQARAQTECYVARLTTKASSPGEPPLILRDIEVLATGEAVCSWTDHFNKEYARQVSLARTLVHLPRHVAGRLLGSYLRSADRPIADLSTVKIPYGDGILRVKTISDVVKSCPSALIGSAS